MSVETITLVSVGMRLSPVSMSSEPTTRPAGSFRNDVSVTDGRHGRDRPPVRKPEAREDLRFDQARQRTGDQYEQDCDREDAADGAGESQPLVPPRDARSRVKCHRLKVLDSSARPCLRLLDDHLLTGTEYVNVDAGGDLAHVLFELLGRGLEEQRKTTQPCL